MVATSSDGPTRAATDQPLGKKAVVAALIEAATGLIIEKGMAVSVREMAARAGVNHGLVHTYFGSKNALIQVALDGINERAAAELDPDGFPPADLASRRDAEVAKAIARVQLDTNQTPFTSHPVAGPWRNALARSQPELRDDEVDAMIAAASALALGWAMYGDQLAATLRIDGASRDDLDAHVFSLVSEMGGLPPATGTQSAGDESEQAS